LYIGHPVKVEQIQASRIAAASVVESTGSEGTFSEEEFQKVTSELSEVARSLRSKNKIIEMQLDSLPSVFACQ
jgi:hypothetical protein